MLVPTLLIFVFPLFGTAPRGLAEKQTANGYLHHGAFTLSRVLRKPSPLLAAVAGRKYPAAIGYGDTALPKAVFRPGIIALKKVLAYRPASLAGF